MTDNQSVIVRYARYAILQKKENKMLDRNWHESCYRDLTNKIK